MLPGTVHVGAPTCTCWASDPHSPVRCAEHDSTHLWSRAVAAVVLCSGCFKLLRQTYALQRWDDPANYITPIEYKQMSGRAGRAGADSQGESILMVQPNARNRQLVQSLAQVSTGPCSGCCCHTLRTSTPARVVAGSARSVDVSKRPLRDGWPAACAVPQPSWHWLPGCMAPLRAVPRTCDKHFHAVHTALTAAVTLRLPTRPSRVP